MVVKRQREVAQASGIILRDVNEVSVDEVHAALKDRVPEVVLEVATQVPATYWKAGVRYFLDDPSYGDVVDIEKLGYNHIYGLFSTITFPGIEDESRTNPEEGVE